MASRAVTANKLAGGGTGAPPSGGGTGDYTGTGGGGPMLSSNDQGGGGGGVVGDIYNSQSSQNQNEINVNNSNILKAQIAPHQRSQSLSGMQPVSEERD